MKYWLMKSEPSVYSISRLKREKKSLWEGVRNYQARNFMTQSMQVGDTVLFYHSSEEPIGISGLARVSRAAVPDPTQFDRRSEYFEPRATLEKPVWYCVEVEFVRQLPQVITLSQIRAEQGLQDMALLQKGQRLSIQPVSEKHFEIISRLFERTTFPIKDL